MPLPQMFNLSGLIDAIQDISQQVGALNESMNNLLPNGAYQPFSQTDASAATNTLYYSTTTSKLTYKDPLGVLHALY